VANSNTEASSPVLTDTRAGTQVSGSDDQAREMHFLLSSLDLAVRSIDTARGCADRHRAAQLLSQAVESYGSVKSLLPKVGLSQEQADLVSARLKAVQECLGDEALAAFPPPSP